MSIRPDIPDSSARYCLPSYVPPCSPARRTDRWLRKLLDRPKAFVACGVFALAVCIVPQLFTLSVTVSYILLAALFYPSGRVLAEWEDRDRRLYLSEHPDEMSDIYHCNHHARLL